MLIRTYSRIKKTSSSSGSIASTASSSSSSDGSNNDHSEKKDFGEERIPTVPSASSSFLSQADISTEFDKILNGSAGGSETEDENDSFTLSLYSDDSNFTTPVKPPKPVDEAQKTLDNFVTKTPTCKRTRSHQEFGTPMKKKDKKAPASPLPQKQRQKQQQQQQLFLDMGQEGLGSVTCPVCGMVFTKGTEDEKVHRAFHKQHERPAPPQKCKVLLKYGESVASFESDGGKVVVVRQADVVKGCKSLRDAVGAVVTRVNAELCFHTSGDDLIGSDSSAAFVYMDEENRAVGCVVAERVSVAHRVIPKEGPDDSAMRCSKEDVKAVAGVSRVWVHPESRRHGVATRLIDTVRDNFLYGYKIPLTELAFSQPTDDGYKLFSTYTGTEKFLVYI